MVDARRLVQQATELAHPALPFAYSVGSSTCAYTLGLAVMQVTGMACRVSCATPVLGPALGVVGVGLASALAGQAAIWCRSHPLDSKKPLTAGRHTVVLQDALLDAVIGVVLFKAMKGRFRSIMPSDLFRAGAHAVESLPATRGADYASEINRGELIRLMRRDGCHHCGRRNGKVIGDHIPPNKLAAVKPPQLSKQFAKLMKEPLKFLQSHPRRRSSWLGGKPVPLFARPVQRAGEVLGLAKVLQRYYPQCQPCSQKQAAAVRAGKRRLVMHFGGPRPWFFAGALRVTA
ncbi:hypothetical protein WJX73_002817 [Symbiochloris irregularis]|uniref:Uncharacterized protein n=1 Tax=Symbiochloris irregularis TaxID=706552 RepID=A0AAW1NT27_9CHLO